MVKPFSCLPLLVPKAFRFRAIFIKPIRPRIQYEFGPEPILFCAGTITTGPRTFFNAGDCGVPFRSFPELAAAESVFARKKVFAYLRNRHPDPRIAA